MENKVIITPNPNFLPNIECVLTRGGGAYMIPHTTLKFYLNEFTDFLQQINEKDWLPMQVSHQGRMQINPRVRSSKVNKNIYTSFTPNRTIRNSSQRKTFYIGDKSCLVIDNELIKFNTTSLVNCISDFTLIRYDEGDHFDEFHYDTVRANDEAKTIGTALLFPPADISPFTGGDLVFKHEEGDQKSLQTIRPSTFKEWTLITYGHLLHKCTPVLSGTRYVFKAQIWSKYPDIMQLTELPLERIIHYISEKQSHKLELLSNARQLIADFYSKYLEDIKIKLEAKKKVILEQPLDKTLELSNASNIDVHVKNMSILIDIEKELRDKKYKLKYGEASCLDYYENTMAIKLDILKRNYNNLVIFLDDCNDNYLTIEHIISTQNFSTKSITLKYNEKKKTEKEDYNEDDYDDDYYNENDFNSELKTVLVLSSLYKEPYDFNDFDIKHLKLLRQLVNSDYKFALFNKRYEMYVEYDMSRCGNSNIRLTIDKENFNWIFECPKYSGQIQNKETEYNDEGGFDNTFTFESTCMLIWRDE